LALRRLDRRAYGETAVWFAEPSAPPPGSRTGA
jgi:hypothetical protein